MDHTYFKLNKYSVVEEISFGSSLKKNLNAKLFFCDQCPKAFKIKIDLEKHVRRHTGESCLSLFSCESVVEEIFVGVSFKKNLNANIFFCDQCRKAFKTKNNLEMHVRRHTDESYLSIFSCESENEISKEKLENSDPKDSKFNNYSGVEEFSTENGFISKENNSKKHIIIQLGEYNSIEEKLLYEDKNTLENIQHKIFQVF